MSHVLSATFSVNTVHANYTVTECCLYLTLHSALKCLHVCQSDVLINAQISQINSAKKKRRGKKRQRTYFYSLNCPTDFSGCCTVETPASADHCAEDCPCSSHYQDPPEDTQPQFNMRSITFYCCLQKFDQPWAKYTFC